MIPRVELPEAKTMPPIPEKKPEQKQIQKAEQKKTDSTAPQEKNLDYFMKKMRERVSAYHQETAKVNQVSKEQPNDSVKEVKNYEAPLASKPVPPKQPEIKKPIVTEKQLDFFEEKLLTKKAVQEYRIIGQLFDTYWLVEFHEQLYIIDQHAAHERVLYEKTLRGMKEREFTSQYLSPPIILHLSMQEEEALNTHMDIFTKIGFEIEPFGGESYAIRAVPDNLFSIAKKELFTEMLDHLVDGIQSSLTPDMVAEKVASMSCKAAVKGNARLSAAEVETLIGELLELENPYHCPHGRPTIIAMTKRELEKKFKRIV